MDFLNRIFLSMPFLTLSFSILSATTPTGPIYIGNSTYYVVNSSNPNLDSGTKVCSAVGLQCVGYTNYDTRICQQLHPNASALLTVNGSRSGFYCNGAPQQGECSSRQNSCESCSACNVNADCNTTIGQFFREMYVQCAVNASKARAQITTITGYLNIGSSLFSKLSSFFSRTLSSFTNLFSKASSIFSGFLNIFNLHSTIVNTTTKLIGPYPGYWACELFQTPWPGVNQKKVTCSAYKAADSFCATVLTSQYATAAYCNDTSGLIVCINPCNKGGQVLPSSCPYDAARQRGSQAPPLNWC